MNEQNFQLVEQRILGTLMKENYLIEEAGLHIDHFTMGHHKNIFSTMQSLYLDKLPVDPVSIMSTQNPEAFGGANYLMQLISFAAPEKVNGYTQILLAHWRDNEKRRHLHDALQDDWSIDIIQKQMDQLQQHNVKQVTSIKSQLVAQYDRPFSPMIANKGVPTQLNDLDTILGGLRAKELIILAARPSMGKTDTMCTIALSAARHQYLPIIFSLEMSTELLIDRFISNVGNYNRLKMRDPYEHFSEQQKMSWASVLGEIDRYNFQIDDRGALNVAQIKATARKIIHEHPNQKPIILIDYLQKITNENSSRNATRTQLVGEISNGLKLMAKEFDCPVVCLSQLSRAVEQRQDKRPMMSDLRESGEIEQDADVVAFLYRDDYYDKESENRNILEIIISKHRNGPTGTANVLYRPETGKIGNIDWKQT